MTIAAFFEAMGLPELELWGAESRACLVQRRDRLQRDQARRDRLLNGQRRIIAAIEERVRVNDRRAASLPDRIEVFTHVHDIDRAWKLALELEATRRDLDHDRAKLREHKADYQENLADFEDVKDRIRDLQRRLGGYA